MKRLFVGQPYAGTQNVHTTDSAIRFIIFCFKETSRIGADSVCLTGIGTFAKIMRFAETETRYQTQAFGAGETYGTTQSLAAHECRLLIALFQIRKARSILSCAFL